MPQIGRMPFTVSFGRMSVASGYVILQTILVWGQIVYQVAAFRDLQSQWVVPFG